MYQILNVDKKTVLIGIEGNITESYRNQLISVLLRADTVDVLISQFAKFVGCDVASAERNVCGEAGRIECSRLEDADGFAISEEQTKALGVGQAGACRAVYTGYVWHCAPVKV